MEHNVTTEIAELKQQMRRQRKLLQFSMIGWVGAIAAFALSSASGLQDLRVKRLALVDAKGVERLILTADNSVAYINGKPYQREHPVSGLMLQNAQGQEMGGMMTDANGNAGIALDGKIGIEPGLYDRVGLFSRSDGNAGFMLNDVNKKKRAVIVSGPELDVEFSLFDINEIERERISTGSK